MEAPSDPRGNLSASPNHQPGTAPAAPSTPSIYDREARPRKKASTACSVCKKRKTKCSGEYPCDRCIQRGTVAECVIDTNADLRRRGATDRRTEELESDRRLLDGLIETIRYGSNDQVQAMLGLVRSDLPRADLLGHVDGLRPGGSVGSGSSVADSEQPLSPRYDERRPSQGAQNIPRGRIQDLLNEEPAKS